MTEQLSDGATWHRDLPQSPWLDTLVEQIEDDPRVLAVLLTGSWAHDMATEHSDVDLLVIMAHDDVSWRRNNQAGIDLQTMTLERLRQIPRDPGRWWDRYSYCRTRTLLDRSQGHVPKLIETWANLSPEEIAESLDYHLEAYLNFLYRSLKSHREGRARLARLDACESLPWAIALAFAVNGRVRPTNKYVAWELEHYPIGEPGWSYEEMTSMCEDILDSGSAAAQRTLFALIEAKARRHGFGGVIDGFDGIALIRG